MIKKKDNLEISRAYGAGTDCVPQRGLMACDVSGSHALLAVGERMPA